ncbi:GNAT family N-acetyltransferase [Bordetella petrii]|nr:GNAT family N-acetyltransferase [Bordetella petrii]
MPDIGTQGLALRRLRPQDAADWYTYLRDEAVTRHTSWQLAGEPDLDRLIAACLSGSGGCVRLAIADTATGRLRGTIGFNEIAAAHARAEIAYDLAPALWNRGIASRACAAVSGWALQSLGLCRVQATVLDTNLASRRVLQRCGFRPEGLLANYRMVRGQPRDFWIYALTRGGRATP